MAKRQASMRCKSAGTPGVLNINTADRKKHPADGASVVIITNRFSGILVEVIKSHGIYSRGSQLIVAPSDILFG